MKRAKKYRSYPAYPNAADRNYYIRKSLDIANALIFCACLIAVSVFLVALV